MIAQARKGARIDIGSIRREQIVEAAVAIIAEQGLQHLSLSEIENRIGMSRGQLTYYFKTKEAILLAVFDRLVQLMHQRQGNEQCAGDAACWQPRSWEEVVRWVLGKILEQPPAHPEFGALQYTFLSQISHREDFRQRLASLYEDWRGQMTEILRGQYGQGSSDRRFSARTVASLIQALFHGVAMQVAADPNAVDREEITELCLEIVGSYLEKQRRGRGRSAKGKISRPSRAKKKMRVAARVAKNGVNHA